MRAMGTGAPSAVSLAEERRRPNRDSFISTDSTTTYASSFSEHDDDSYLSDQTETPPSQAGPSSTPSRQPLTTASRTMYDDPPSRSHVHTPTRSAPASRQQTPQRSAVIRHQPSRSEVREVRDPALSATPPRRDSGQVRQMVEKLNPEHMTPQRATRTSQMAPMTDPVKVKQRTSQMQLRPRPSEQRLVGERESTTARKSAGPDGREAARRHSAQVEPTRQSGHSYSQANPPNVRTGTDQIAIPRRPAQNTTATRPARLAPPASNKHKQPPSPAQSRVSFAEEWEEELIKRAKTLRIPDVKPTTQAVQIAHRGDADMQDWERMGMANEARLEGRDAEDRSRRDAQRQIAYPPQMLSQPIRAVASGVTSVHIGVRPRIHPSRAESSLAVNQPDTTLPEPLFSPLPSAGASPSGASTPRSGGEGRYSAEKYAQAQKEYEDWLSRKAEREMGIGQPHDGSAGGTGSREDGFGQGSSSWQPREREPARFGYLYGANEGYPANLGKGTQAQPAMQAQGQLEAQQYQRPQIANHAYDPEAQAQVGQMGVGQGLEHMAHMGQMLPGAEGQQGSDGMQMHDMYGYGNAGGTGQWDPAAYWWMMQQMQMAQMAQMGYDGMGGYMGMMPGHYPGNEVSPITSEESSDSSGSEAVEQAPKVHFAPSPTRNRSKPRRRRSMLGLNLPISAQGAIQQESVTGSPAMPVQSFDPAAMVLGEQG